MENSVISAKKSEEMLDYLLRRRSVPIRDITEPGPAPDALSRILQIAARVPDHGKLAPWYFVVISGDARVQMGAQIRDIYARKNPDAEAQAIEAEAQRFMRAPVAVAVISRRREGKSPWYEQILSVGAACYNMVLASHASGFAAVWLSEWMAYDDDVLALLGGEPSRDHIAGFIYIGTMGKQPDERDRPDMDKIVTYWQPGGPVNKGDEYNRAGYGFADKGF